jgi:hypothetical protein
MNGKPWTYLETDLLRRWWANTSMPILVATLGHSASSIQNKAKSLRLSKGGRHVWTEEQDAVLRALYADTLSAEIAQQLGLDLQQVHRRAHLLGLKKSRETVARIARERAGPDHPMRKSQFKPGLRPWNTGKKITLPEKCKATQFKPGQRPHTWVPIGTTRVSPDGYLEVKFADVPDGHYKRWIPVHRQLWIQAHGPIPPGHVIAFKLGRRTTVLAEITLDAIECITLKENMARNTIHNRLPPELRQVAQLRGLLTRAINRKTKEGTNS